MTPLETTGENSFSLEGFEKMLFQFKILRRVIYIPLEGFRCPSWGVIIPLEGFRYPSCGFIIPLEGFSYPSKGFIIPLRKILNWKSIFSNPSSEKEFPPVVSSGVKILLRTSVTLYDITDYRGESDVTWFFYLSTIGDDIFRTLERIKVYQPYSTIWIQ